MKIQIVAAFNIVAFFAGLFVASVINAIRKKALVDGIRLGSVGVLGVTLFFLISAFVSIHIHQRELAQFSAETKGYVMSLALFRALLPGLLVLVVAWIFSFVRSKLARSKSA